MTFEPSFVPGQPGAGDWLLVFVDARQLLSPPGKPGLAVATVADWTFPLVTTGVGYWQGKAVWASRVESKNLPEALDHGAALLDIRAMYRADAGPDFAMLSRALHAVSWNGESTWCPRCGGALAWRLTEFGKICGQCSFEVFPRINPAVIMAVLDGPRILLARGKGQTMPFWSLLAGYVEIGESLEETVVREVKEESGLHVEHLVYVGSQPWPFSQSLMAGFTCQLAGGTLKPDPAELEDARWFRLDDLPATPPPPSMAWRIISGLRACR